jgi:hypothetical protein
MLLLNGVRLHLDAGDVAFEVARADLVRKELVHLGGGASEHAEVSANLLAKNAQDIKTGGGSDDSLSSLWEDEVGENDRGNSGSGEELVRVSEAR